MKDGKINGNCFSYVFNPRRDQIWVEKSLEIRGFVTAGTKYLLNNRFLPIFGASGTFLALHY